MLLYAFLIYAVKKHIKVNALSTFSASEYQTNTKKETALSAFSEAKLNIIR